MIEVLLFDQCLRKIEYGELIIYLLTHPIDGVYQEVEIQSHPGENTYAELKEVFYGNDWIYIAILDNNQPHFVKKIKLTRLAQNGFDDPFIQIEGVVQKDDNFVKKLIDLFKIKRRQENEKNDE